jgi:hypoxanthine phosphoribosyltransferase
MKSQAHLDDDFPGLVAICVLKGGHQFFADLLNAVKRINQSLPHSVPISLEFFKISSYVNDKSSGSVDIALTGNETWADVQKRLKGKHLLVVEDIIDTGRTMKAFTEKLNQLQAASVRVTSLFLKRTHLSNGYVPDYVGFSIPDKFIVGYCLDYNEYFRDLDHVCVINETGKAKYAK